MDRRKFIKSAGLAIPIASNLPMSSLVFSEPSSHNFSSEAKDVTLQDEKADYTIHIGTGLVEVGTQHIISTTTYNGEFPGPLLRFKEGQKAIVDIYNDTDTPEQLHWHGQFLPTDVDGAAEEGTPYIPAHGMRREVFVPTPAGFRFYHTHLVAGANLNVGQYSGQVGPVYIEPKNEPGNYDREAFIILKEFEPYFMRGGDMAMDFLTGESIPNLAAIQEKAEKESPIKTKGYEVGYNIFTINGHQLGHGEPIRVKEGERVLFHILNGSATEIRSLALPGHSFKVVALDGNPVPNPRQVPVLWLGTAERISAIVEMRNPGIWVMGDLSDDDRSNGMGIVIEYANHTGKPQWKTPAPFKWDYTIFGNDRGIVSPPDEVINLLFAKQNAAENGFNRWTINGVAFNMMDMSPMFHLQQGKRYRLHMRNASDDIHPMHLHRHSFEITRIGGKSTKGIIKDVVMLGGFQEMHLDFTADNPGLTLMHCHMQLHMDFGFMCLFNYK
ncbi:MAG: multicopper oxidase domain-containing protein [Hydrotalea flava]|uniref:multicopper oxidase family protein n=1 Tax=Hydrotalea lipotrueae TaxID=2803817 RepID=UPI0009423FC1|nr:multicopper oxidase domain-containing protein [Hydrotalea lipotrueae]MBY0347768.1 multicopper oxidase domain-containing protein [Hydrotalea flava]